MSQLLPPERLSRWVRAATRTPGSRNAAATGAAVGRWWHGARPDLPGLRTLADSYINSQYASAAPDGLADAENVLGNQFDYGSFLAALAGNLIRAAACFSTGGTAFVISVAGIAVSAGAGSCSTNVDRAAFRLESTRMIDGIVTHLLNQIDRVTRDVDAVASERNLSDADTRRELLQRLLKPEDIQTVPGGLAAVNRAAITHRIQTDLLIKANAAPGGMLRSDGRFQYDYTVTNFMTERGI